MLKRNARWRDRQSGCGQFPTPTFPSPNPMRDPVPLPSRRAVGGVAVAEGGEDVIHVVLRGLPGDHPHEQLRLLRRRRRRRLLHVPPRSLEPHRDRPVCGIGGRRISPPPPSRHIMQQRFERWGGWRDGESPAARRWPRPWIPRSPPNRWAGRTREDAAAGAMARTGGYWCGWSYTGAGCGHGRARTRIPPGGCGTGRETSQGHTQGGVLLHLPGHTPGRPGGGVPWRQCELETRQRCFLLTPSRGWGSGSPRRPREPAAAAYFTLTGRFAPGNVCLPP